MIGQEFSMVGMSANIRECEEGFRKTVEKSVTGFSILRSQNTKTKGAMENESGDSETEHSAGDIQTRPG